MMVDPENPPMWVRFGGSSPHLLAIEGTRLFALTDDAGDVELPTAGGRMDVVPAVRPQHISLNVSSACNLACSYCYAGRGGFDGKQISTMREDVAFSAVDALLERCNRRVLATVGFMGGEPFLNGRLIHRVVEYAASRAIAAAQPLGFSATTNGLLLRPVDLQLLRDHRFAVTVSVDGGDEIQDAQRPRVGGKPSASRLREAIEPLIASPGQARLCARMTVSRNRLDLMGRFDDVEAMGFRDIGLAPVRTGPQGITEWSAYTASLLELGQRELARLISSGHSAFSNLVVAIKQLGRGASMPYACGAGGSYFSVGADGVWYACHRGVGNETYALGQGSPDLSAGHDFLAERHVLAKAECRVCWARYLCSGGCHHELDARSISSCDAIREWLAFCLEAWAALRIARPDWFSLLRSS